MFRKIQYLLLVIGVINVRLLLEVITEKQISIWAHKPIFQV